MDQLRLTWEEMVKAWRDDFFDEGTLQRLAAVFPTWLLAEGQPVPPDTIAKAVNRRLTVTPEGITRVDPSTTAVSVVIPGVNPPGDL